MRSLFSSLRRSISRTNTYYHSPGEPIMKSVTLLPGVFIGPEITDSVKQIFRAAKVPVHFDVLEDFDFKRPEHKEALKKNKHLLMGNTGRKGSMTLEHTDFYRFLDLHARVVHAYNFPGINTRHKNVDIVVIRENLEGEFSGVEHEVVPGVFESIKICTKENSLRIANYAFEYAFLSGRKRVTAVHKANIMKLVDGLFLEACREVAQRFPSILFDEIIIDNCAMQLAARPHLFDVMVMPNLYGSIVSSICVGLVGGAGMVAGASIGAGHMLFDQAARNSGFDIAGKNLANPTALIIASVNMLKSMHLSKFADVIHTALLNVYEEGKVMTKDVSGNATTDEFTARVCDEVVKLD